jgi:hypothetical protein
LAVYALYSLDEALGALRSFRIAVAAASIALAILTDYSLVLFCPAIALYGFARLWESRAPRRFWLLWSGAQFLALGVFGALYWFQVRHLPDSASDYGYIWIKDGFRLPGQSLFAFAWNAITSQFISLTGSTLIGLLIALAVLLALRKTSMPWRILLLTPFLTGTLLSLLRFFPFGPSRHSSIVSAAIAVGLGIAAQTWLASRSRIRPMAVPIVVMGAVLVVQQFQPRAAAAYRARQEVREGSRYIAELASTGHPIFASGEAKNIVDIYQALQRQPRIRVEATKGWNLADDEIEPVFADFRRRHSIPPARPVIFVGGGFRPYRFPDPQPAHSPRQFGTIQVWEIYEYGNSTPAASPPSLPPR